MKNATGQNCNVNGEKTRGMEGIIPLGMCLERYTVKKRLSVLPSPAGMSLTKLSLAGNYQIIPVQEEFGK
jgi:hypothetical protein